MKINNLDPREVFSEFENISKIPRASYKESGVKNYIKGVTESLGLEYIEDESDNCLVIKKDGFQKEILTFQAHMDMVCVKNKDSLHDFSKDPINTIVQGDLIYADGTSLGADNGIGVAYMLSLMKNKAGNFFFLFTSAEEVGLVGARNLGDKIKNTLSSSKYLINLDSEDEGEFCVGCAGDTITGGKKKLAAISPAFKNFYNISFMGLLGGHSGIDIAKGRVNAIKTACQVFMDMQKFFKFYVGRCDIGEVHNAIPREGSLTINCNAEKEEIENFLSKINVADSLVIPQSVRDSLSDTLNNAIKKLDINNEAQFLKKIEVMREKIKELKGHNINNNTNYAINEAKSLDEILDLLKQPACGVDVFSKELNSTVEYMAALHMRQIDGTIKSSRLVFTVETANPVDKVYNFEEIFDLVCQSECGVISFSKKFDNLVSTSINIALLKLDQGEVLIQNSIRSDSLEKVKDLNVKVVNRLKCFGFTVLGNTYCLPWEPNFNSHLLKRACETYKEYSKNEPIVNVIHAGLECGVIINEIKGMEAISFGPNIKQLHSPKENVSIQSVKRVYEYLLYFIDNF